LQKKKLKISRPPPGRLKSIDFCQASAFTAEMRLLLVGMALLLCGCAGKTPARQAEAYTAVQPSPTHPIITLDTGALGKIMRVHQDGKFVVINFPFSRFPRLDDRLNVYRQGQKVGEVKIVGPQLEDNFVANITAGQLQPGDEVRP
jgi:hypothetical protein